MNDSHREPGCAARVVITGIGIVSPLGCDVETVWSNLVEGVSGTGPVTLFDATGFGSRVAAEVRGFRPEDHMDRKSARNLDRFAQFGLAASQLALAGAGLDLDEMEADSVGVLIASAAGGIGIIERNCSALVERGHGRMSPFTLPMMIVNNASGVVAMRCGAGGPSYAIASACASSTHGIGEAFEIIRRGDAKVMLAGGADACVTPFMMGGFSNINAMSQRNHDAEHASRPFDRERDGFVMAEGAVTLVLEEHEFAQQRGAPVIAEIAGYGATSDMYHITAPHPQGDGAVRSMRRALQKAGAEQADVTYVNAHGPGTKLGDLSETIALKRCFGAHAPRLAVSSTKSMHGHMMGAAGAMEAAVCALAAQRSVIPPTINLDQPDPACDLDYVPNRSRSTRVDVAISNSLGFGGHNATLVIRALRN